MKCRIHKCHAACCYNIPFEHGELDKFADKIVNEVLFTVPLGSAVVAFTIEDVFDIQHNKCPFLRSDCKCNIYEDRPDVCKKMGEIPQSYPANSERNDYQAIQEKIRRIVQSTMQRTWRLQICFNREKFKKHWFP